MRFALQAIVILISILLKTAFWQTPIYSQSLVKTLKRSDEDKIIFKAIVYFYYLFRNIIILDNILFA